MNDPQSAFILVVEDDPVVADQIIRILRRHDYDVLSDLNRGRILELAGSDFCSAILLDLGLPEDDGLEIARLVRRHSKVPILMITGRTGIHERVVGLDAGADDYIVKPFAADELAARLRAVMRRSDQPARRQAADIAIVVGGGQVIVATRVLTGPNGSSKLTEQELRLLRALVASNGPLSRRDAYLTVFHRAWDPFDRSFDVHVSNLRRKLKTACGDTALISTVRGKGYDLIGHSKIEKADSD